ATIVRWLKQPGDHIEEDESILEVATDKVDSDVPSPVSGTLREQLFSENSIAQVGDVIAIIEADGGDSDGAIATKPIIAEEIPGMDQLVSDVASTTVPAIDGGLSHSPTSNNL